MNGDRRTDRASGGGSGKRRRDSGGGRADSAGGRESRRRDSGGGPADSAGRRESRRRDSGDQPEKERRRFFDDAREGPARSSRPAPSDGRRRDRQRGARGDRPGRRDADAPPRAQQSGASPEIPADITADQLHASVRAELRTLPRDLADLVARHLAAADEATDPEEALRQAAAARQLAARVGVVREACGVAAYLAGHWAEALSELRAARRLTGRGGYLAMMADSERALGRLDRALALVTGPDAATADRAEQVELRIVESGIRRDMGAFDAAVVVLQIPELAERRLRPWSARLFYAYADALLDAGRTDEAYEWFRRAAAADPDGETDAADRFDELDDVTIEDLEGDADEGDSPHAP